MPKSDTWPGGVAMESVSSMDSAGSCDSVISVNSGFSEDSLEHLSAEERACLTYLEETIESLEVEEDSGLSNDEPDSRRTSAKMAQLSSSVGHTRVDDVPSFKHDDSGREQSFLSCGVPTPLLLANGVPSLPSSIAQPKTPEVPTEPASTARKVEHCAPNQATETQMAVAGNNSKDVKMSVDLDLQPETLSATQTDMLNSATVGGGDNNLDSVSRDTKLYSSDVNLGLIPPPSDFMDEPGPQPELVEEKELPLSAGTSGRSPSTRTDLEDLHKKASIKKTPVSSPVPQDPSSKPPVEVPDSPSVPASPSAALSNPLTEAAEPRCPPAVAPKPKKLPSNIILKSHKAPVAGSDNNPGHSVSASSDRVLLDPQRVRMEALRKLGLLKSEEADSGPALSPKLSPKSRRSWAAPPSPISTAPSLTPTPPSTPSPALVINPAPAPVPVKSPTPGAIPPPATSIASAAIAAPDILPAPAAFSDHTEPLPSHTEPPSVAVCEQTPRSLATPKGTSIKSATLERSGLGLSSYMTSQQSSASSEVGQGAVADHGLSQLRNTRPRPASLGSGQDFSCVQGKGLQPGQPTCQDPDTRRSPPTSAAPQATGDSQKLPRSHGISVLICPQAKNGEDRREALKKLGLLRH
ncbi:specifically androgen-regulated gene protein [Polymixia lowei]